MQAKRLFSAFSALIIGALLLGACAPAASTAAPQTPQIIVQTVVVAGTSAVQTVVVPGTPQVQTVVVTATPPPAVPKTIDVLANWGGAEKDAFQKVLDGFTAKTGIPVNYESSRNLETLVRTRVAGGSPPDVVMEPRPGAIAEFVASNWLVPLDEPIGKEVLDPHALTMAFGDAYINLGKVNGTLFGLIFKTDSKSTFWYKPASFTSLGVQPPKTLDELMAIADKYKAAGKIPFAAGGKDGWPLTDYFENLYLRLAGADQYNALQLSHKVAWTDPLVKTALTDFTKFFQPGYNPGGPQGVLGTLFTDSIAQVFGPNPVAEMLYEGGFVGTIAIGQTNTSLKPVQDINFFTFPQVDPALGDPVVGGGDFAIMFKDTPEGRAFMQYLASKEAGEIFAGTNSISPNKLVDPTKFSSELRKTEFQQIANAKVFVFDGSDMAPSAFGGGCEFSLLQELVANPKNVNPIAQALEDCAKANY